MAGTVNISRDLWDDPTFKDAEFSQREAWIWMIAEAAWKPHVRRFGAHEISLQRGQLAASTRFMAKAFGWTESRVRRYLELLKNRRMVQTEIDAGVTVISICKYDTYQNGVDKTDAPPTRRPTQDRRTTDAKEKKGRREEGEDIRSYDLLGEAPLKQKRRCRLPDGWVPNDRNLQDAHSKQFTDEEINHEANRFRDHHHAKGSTMLDWDAAWRTWLGNARKFAAPRNASAPRHAGGGGTHDALYRGFQRAAGKGS